MPRKNRGAWVVSDTFFSGAPGTYEERMYDVGTERWSCSGGGVVVDVSSSAFFLECALLETYWDVLVSPWVWGLGYTPRETGRLAPRRPAIIEARGKQG